MQKWSPEPFERATVPQAGSGGDAPAFATEAASVSGGDVVISVDGMPVDPGDIDDTVLRLRGPAGTVYAGTLPEGRVYKIATATGRPDKVFGLHYFNPAVLMRLIEVIKADETSEETMQIGMDFAKKQRKVGVYVKKDSPGFIVNRVNHAMSVLFGEILERGEIEPEPLDAFMRTMGAAMGPCELLDYVGVDVAVTEGLWRATAGVADAPLRSLKSAMTAAPPMKRAARSQPPFLNHAPFFARPERNEFRSTIRRQNGET